MATGLKFKDYQQENRVFSARLMITLLVVCLLALVLGGRMVWLQAMQHERYTMLSDRNRVQTQPLAPPRGLIRDREGRILADNRPNFSVALVPEQIGDMEETLRELNALVELEENDIRRFQRQLESPRRPWEPVPLRARMDEEELARVAVNQHRLPGVRIDATPIRNYPHGEMLSHALGYVNRLSRRDLENMTAEQRARYAGTHFHGRDGLEAQYEGLLHGSAGYRRVETNARGRILRVLEEEPPQPGDDLQLHLDLEVQRAAWDALEGRRGAIVAMDPRDGGILAFASRPGFDPNKFVTGISREDFNAYRDDLDRPLFNRILQGQYPPGSTIKMMHALAGLEHGVVEWEDTIWDPGYFELPGQERPFRDWKREGHGWVDMHRAIAESCDTYFYKMAYELGIDRMQEFNSGFGFGRRTGIDLPNERPGIQPSREWKRQAHGESWYHGDTINTSIGQGYMLSTPLQLAYATTMLSRRGDPVLPRLAANAGEEGMVVREPVQLEDPGNWGRMQAAMEHVLHGERGTARMTGLRSNYRIAGKTGTSQVFSLEAEEEYDEDEIEERLRDHALFIGFAPSEDPSIAVAVLVENGGSGGGVAAPKAREVMDAWLLDENGDMNPPPPLEQAQAQGEESGT